MNKSLEDIAFEKAAFLIEHNLIQGMDEDIDIFDVTDLLIKLEKEKLYKNLKSDENIDFNDEIVSIEEVGILDTIDISVSGDNLFYCNDILTKNSFGIPAISDMLFALVNSDELKALDQVMIKQIKNRYTDVNSNTRFVVGINRPMMKLYDAEDSAQVGITWANQTPAVQVPTAAFGTNGREAFKKKNMSGIKV
jgi:hypothetical protein